MFGVEPTIIQQPRQEPSLYFSLFISQELTNLISFGINLETFETREDNTIE